jgi:hypothetical protein
MKIIEEHTEESIKDLDKESALWVK